MDLTLALGSAVVTLPLAGLSALLVKRSMGSPVIYRSQRAGLGGRPFTMLKFRTMTNDTDAEGRPLPDDQRLTRVGELLRSTSLDELPQLVNVVRGDMSLVGPRPLLVEYTERYSPEQALRLEVPPGLTGWAGVDGNRNDQTWDEKLARDAWYVRHVSFALDVKIIFKTVVLVLSRKGVSRSGHATAPEFQGDRPAA